MPTPHPAVCLSTLLLILTLGAAPRAQDAWVGLDAARAQLELAMLQQREPEQWQDVRQTVFLAQESLLGVDEDFDPNLFAAMSATLQTISVRQDATDKRWQAVAQAQSDHAGDEAALGAALSSIDTRWTTAATQLAENLLTYQGLLPETHVVASELLFDAGLDSTATASLRDGLMRWPDNALIHEQLRAWPHRLTTTEGFLEGLSLRIDALGDNSPQSVGQALETRAALHEELGQRAYAAAQLTTADTDYADAARSFEAAARDIRRSRSIARQLSEDDVAAQRAQSLLNAGWAHYAVAQKRWFEAGREDPAAWDAAGAAQQDFIDALRSEPGNRSAEVALTSLGTLVGTKAQDVDPLALGPEDMADIRDYFGDLAPRFEIAEWWNNFALFSRDTGVAAAGAGDLETAKKLWEQSYQAYEKAIAIDPTDARMTNDTGLMLLYHLDRDLERAEELFQRAWEMGAEACNNPFADPESDSYQTDLGGYTDAMLNLALLNAQRGDLERASEVIDELVAIAPARPDARGLKASIDASLANREP